ncbi:hypothetical protein B0T17DRAFT_542903 [Bombardia bombarda]|uniref:Uncharacterized protein n=1 Tax=Bombardia bombarda TaxID=252184 RepID=A0AA39U819_9PEZI|nr:hypothetical protein B0T17DRAFT_542903 [Bombardia bombarda]
MNVLMPVGMLLGVYRPLFATHSDINTTHQNPLLWSYTQSLSLNVDLIPGPKYFYVTLCVIFFPHAYWRFPCI